MIVMLLIKRVADTAAFNASLHRPLAMGKVVIFLTYVLLTACRNLSTEITLESATGRVTPQSGINERGTAIVLQTNAPVLTDENSTFLLRTWTQLTTDANAHKRASQSNITANGRGSSGVEDDHSVRF